MDTHYELEEINHGEPDREPAGQTAPPVDADALCIDCGYSLRGLPVDGKCPECGKPVADSIRGELLINRSPQYVRKLTRGISLVLNGILLWFVLKFLAGPALTIVLPILQYNTGKYYSSSAYINFSLVLANFLVSGMILYGYWLFTARDPGDPVRDRAPTARIVVRASVIAQFVFQLISVIKTSLTSLSISQIQIPASGSAAAPVSPMLMIVGILLFIIWIGALAAWVTQFFAAMLYVKMLSRRFPDPKVFRLANSRIISCPIWATVGILIIFGPLIALILYWNLLNMVRARLKQIRNAQQHKVMDEQIAGLSG